MVNARTKGQTGEREIATKLNGIIEGIYARMGMGKPEPSIIQRNQNQTAVGGSDLTNPYGLCIEVKRQESLSVKKWWEQTLTSARRENGYPVLIFRQNRRSWSVMMPVYIPDPSRMISVNTIKSAGIVSLEVFLEWFKNWVIFSLQSEKYHG